MKWTFVLLCGICFNLIGSGIGKSTKENVDTVLKESRKLSTLQTQSEHRAAQEGQIDDQVTRSLDQVHSQNCPDGTMDGDQLALLEYDNNVDCTWILNVPDDKIIKVTIQQLNIEEGVGCMYDYLKLTDATGSAALCGTLQSGDPCTLVSSGSSVVISFHSDDSITSWGFSLTYEAIDLDNYDDDADCPSLFHDDVTSGSGEPGGGTSGGQSDECPAAVVVNGIGGIVSPGFPSAYDNNANCQWTIEVNAGKVILLSIVLFNLEGVAQTQCLYDFLTINDPTLGSPVALCGSLNLTNKCVYVSNGNNLTLDFTTDFSVTLGGFVLAYQAVDPGIFQTQCSSLLDPSFSSEPYQCDPVVLTDNLGTITSPKFPEDYPSNAHCRWKIEVAQGLRIAVLVRILSMQPMAIYDYLTISPTTAEGEKVTLSGEIYNMRFLSVANTLEITFTSDASVTGPGFQLEYTAFAEGQAIPYTLPHSEFKCGEATVVAPDTTNSTDRIVGGQEAFRFSWPWMLGFYIEGRFFCGASILSRKWAITAAHCILADDGITVTAGDHTLKHYDGGEQTVAVDEVIPHPDYDPTTTDNDIAILKLASPFYFNQIVRPVCVVKHQPPMDSECFATGWGDTRGTASDVTLNVVELPLKDTATCNQTGWYDGSMTNNMFCAGREEGGIDTCQGDSGGPFVCKVDDDTWAITGLTSWGIGCAEERRLGVYTKLARYTSWIRENTEGHVQFVD